NAGGRNGSTAPDGNRERRRGRHVEDAVHRRSGRAREGTEGRGELDRALEAVLRGLRQSLADGGGEPGRKAQTGNAIAQRRGRLDDVLLDELHRAPGLERELAGEGLVKNRRQRV